MKGEKKTGIPISLCSGFAIPTENGKAVNAMHASLRRRINSRKL